MPQKNKKKKKNPKLTTTTRAVVNTAIQVAIKITFFFSATFDAVQYSRATAESTSASEFERTPERQQNVRAQAALLRSAATVGADSKCAH